MNRLLAKGFKDVNYNEPYVVIYEQGDLRKPVALMTAYEAKVFVIDLIHSIEHGTYLLEILDEIKVLDKVRNHIENKGDKS